MGKKKHSRFVTAQKNNARKQSKDIRNFNRKCNKVQKSIDEFNNAYNNEIGSIYNEFSEKMNIDLEKIPKNSRVAIYEILKNNLNKKLIEYKNLLNEEDCKFTKEEINQCIDVCNNGLNQIDLIYNWKIPFKDIEYTDYINNIFEDENIISSLNKLIKELNIKDFDSINFIIDTLNNCKNEFKENLIHDFKLLCYFITRDNFNLSNYNIYISNTFKNLCVIDSNDKLVIEFLTKDYKSNTTINESDS